MNMVLQVLLSRDCILFRMYISSLTPPPVTISDSGHCNPIKQSGSGVLITTNWLMAALSAYIVNGRWRLQFGLLRTRYNM